MKAWEKWIAVPVFAIWLPLIASGTLSKCSYDAQEAAQKEQARQVKSAQAKPLQVANVAAFEKILPAPNLIAEMRADPGNPNGIYLFLERTWDVASIKEQREARLQWLVMWQIMCSKSKETEVTLFGTDGNVLDILKPAAS